jgi:hypothetical protein
MEPHPFYSPLRKPTVYTQVVELQPVPRITPPSPLHYVLLSEKALPTRSRRVGEGTIFLVSPLPTRSCVMQGGLRGVIPRY